VLGIAVVPLVTILLTVL